MLTWVDGHSVRYLDGDLARSLDVAPVTNRSRSPIQADTSEISADGSVIATATADDIGYQFRFRPTGDRTGTGIS